jgi:hypothetical protein
MKNLIQTNNDLIQYVGKILGKKIILEINLQLSIDPTCEVSIKSFDQEIKTTLEDRRFSKIDLNGVELVYLIHANSGQDKTLTINSIYNQTANCWLVKSN